MYIYVAIDWQGDSIYETIVSDDPTYCMIEGVEDDLTLYEIVVPF